MSLQAVQVYYLYCDNHGCNNFCGPWKHQETLFAVADELGWCWSNEDNKEDSFVLCPKCCNFNPRM